MKREFYIFTGTNSATLHEGTNLWTLGPGRWEVTCGDSTVVSNAVQGVVVGSARSVEVGENVITLDSADPLPLALTCFGLGASARIVRACLRLFSELPIESINR